MGNTPTRTTAASTPKPELPHALADYMHIGIVADELNRALDLLDAHDREHGRDAITRRPRKAARTFVRQSVRYVPEPKDEDDTGEDTPAES